MSDILVNFGLTSHFSSRFKHFLLFLEATNNEELACSILAFLSVRDLLEFTSCSTHFRKLTRIEPVQIRLLRAKLQFYEKPKVLNKLDSLLHYYSFSGPQEIPIMASDKMSKEHEALKQFNKGLKFFNYLKKEGTAEGKEQLDKDHMRKMQTNKIQSQLKRNEAKVDQKLFEPVLKQEEVALAREKQIRTFRKYQEHFQNRKTQVTNNTSNNRISENQGKPQFIPYIPTLEELEYNHARQDYERRKMKRMQTQSAKQFIPYDEMLQLAEKDPCSREVFSRVYKDEIEQWQRQNAARLYVKPSSPKNRISQIERERQQFVKKIDMAYPIHLSLSDKVFIGLKNMFRRKE